MLVTLKGFDVEQFQAEGFTGPVRVFSEAEAAELRRKFYAEIGQDEAHPGPTNKPMSAWHHRLRWFYNLAANEQILDLIEALQGPNLVMWAMHFWYKEPRSGKRIPWHQDGEFWPMTPVKNISAWVAFGPAFRANGCLRIIPGSHRRKYAHIDLKDPQSAFGKGIDPREIDESKAIDFELRPGEVVIFNESAIHGSEANTSGTARVAHSIRYTTPEVKFLMEQWSDAGRIRTYLMRGADTHHLNDAIRGAVPADA